MRNVELYLEGLTYLFQRQKTSKFTKNIYPSNKMQTSVSFWH